MTKPIYRYLADRKWRTYERPLLVQRITQMNILPDLLPGMNPIVATNLAFPLPTLPHKRKNIPHGDVVEARLSENPAILTIQPFTAGEQLVTIAVVNPDVPDVANDGYTSRCHFLACNVPISAVNTRVKLAALDKETQVVHPWLPAYAQKGLEKQRMAIFVLAQRPAADGSSTTINVADVKTAREGMFGKRENFSLRSLLPKFGLSPIGVDLFRTTWDASTAAVMKRAGIKGWDVEFKRKRVEPLPYQRLKENRYR
jgi:large subunit ribosomal protein L35